MKNIMGGTGNETEKDKMGLFTMFATKNAKLIIKVKKN